MDRFWMVYRLGGNGSTRMHDTKDSAVQEAKRLSKANIGSTFVVLKSLKGYRASEPKVETVELIDLKPEEYHPYF